MKRILNLSFDYKLPLWGGILIVTTTLVVTGSLMVASYRDVRADLLTSSANLSRRLAEAVLPPLMEDDVWAAFEIINAPLADQQTRDDRLPDTIVILGSDLKVIASTRPKVIPMLATLGDITPEHDALARRISAPLTGAAQYSSLQDAHSIFVMAPIVSEESRIGTLIVIHSKDVFLQYVLRIAKRGGLVGLLVLGILLPINWYWGSHMARPLAMIARRMNDIDKKSGSDIDLRVYPYQDELGQVLAAYRRLLSEQEGQVALEQQVIHSERLAAVGHLAAGVAHEINNPLMGMLTAIDTLKSYGLNDMRTIKTIAMVERGLFQIKETVGALLVEARIKSRNLDPQDFEDIRSLVIAQALRKEITFDWRSSISHSLPLQANPVRQLLINLLLNAIRAANHKGLVVCSIDADDSALHITVENDGKKLTDEQAAHLFEPFSPLSEHGLGLGLWVTYQIVQQLRGQIDLDPAGPNVRFRASLPVDTSA